ncbi:MAG: hypothetical protein AB7Q97_13120 [Gammaproteobacteria bacterium]
MFAYVQFRRFLQHAAGRVRIVPLGQADGTPALILRHDVDLDLELALRLAQVEHDCGVRAREVLFADSMHHYDSVLAGNTLREILRFGRVCPPLTHGLQRYKLRRAWPAVASSGGVADRDPDRRCIAGSRFRSARQRRVARHRRDGWSGAAGVSGPR